MRHTEALQAGILTNQTNCKLHMELFLNDKYLEFFSKSHRDSLINFELCARVHTHFLIQNATTSWTKICNSMVAKLQVHYTHATLTYIQLHETPIQYVAKYTCTIVII